MLHKNAIKHWCTTALLKGPNLIYSAIWALTTNCEPGSTHYTLRPVYPGVLGGPPVPEPPASPGDDWREPPEAVREVAAQGKVSVNLGV